MIVRMAVSEMKGHRSLPFETLGKSRNVDSTITDVKVYDNPPSFTRHS